MEHRTNIVIDPQLMRQAMELSGAKSQREAVDVALRAYVGSFLRKGSLTSLLRRIDWEGDLDEMRKPRFPDYVDPADHPDIQ